MPVWKTALILMGLALLASPVQAQYRLIDLDTGTTNYSTPTGINVGGQIVGFTYPDRVPFLWNTGVFTDLRQYGNIYTPRSINASGAIAGDHFPPTSNGQQRGFLIQNGNLTDLGVLGWNPYNIGPVSQATAVNAVGQVVGYSHHALTSHHDHYHAYLWQNGVMTDLGTLDGGYSYAEDINASGQVVGHSGGVQFWRHAFSWQNGVMTDLDGGSGGESRAYGINDQGQIVGARWAWLSGRDHATMWENGVPTDLHTQPNSTSYALDINNSGQVVGYFGDTPASYRGFLWQNGVMTDLNTLIPDHPGWTIFLATAINDAGQILGEARDPQGIRRAILLTSSSSSDTDPPITTATLTSPTPNAAGWINRDWRVAFNAMDGEGGSGVKSITYQVPLFPVVTVPGDNAAVQGSREGILDLRYFAEDNAGNVEAEQIITLKMDMTQPVATASIIGDTDETGAYRGQATVELSATDDRSGVAQIVYSVDGGEEQVYTAPLMVTGSGPHTLSYRAIDVADNSQSPQPLAFTITDVIAPATTATVTTPVNAAGWINQDWRVAFTAVDDPGGSGVKSITYQVPQFPVVTTLGDNVAVQGSREGLLDIRYFAEDNVGNVETEKSLTIKVDMTKPVTTGSAIDGQPGRVTLTATDSLSGVAATYYRVNGGPTTAYTTTFGVGQPGTNTVEYWSVDVAGNEEDHKTLTVSSGAPRLEDIAWTPVHRGGETYEAVIGIVNTGSQPAKNLRVSSVTFEGGNLSVILLYVNWQGTTATGETYWNAGGEFYEAGNRDLQPGGIARIYTSAWSYSYRSGSKVTVTVTLTWEGGAKTFKKKLTLP